MVRVALQPASSGTNKRVEDNLARSIRPGFELARCKPYLGDELYQQLETLFPEGTLPLWGLMRKKTNTIPRRHAELQVGDIVLFYGRKEFYYGGIVGAKWESAALAEEVWGVDEEAAYDLEGDEPNGKTWKYMYALVNAGDLSIPLEELQEWTGGKPTSHPMAFQFLDKAGEPPAASAQVLDHLELEPAVTRANEVADPVELDAAVRASFVSTDRRTTSISRTEQALLRKAVIPTDPHPCGICGQVLPRRLLVAAHIKLRAKASEAERMDFERIAMPACAFGCDALFELGYIGVSDGGRIEVSPRVAEHPDLQSRVDMMLPPSSIAVAWNHHRAPNFGWHLQETYQED